MNWSQKPNNTDNMRFTKGFMIGRQTRTQFIKLEKLNEQDRLPYLQNGSIQKQQKLNQVRYQAYKTRENVQLLKARINALRKQKQKNSKQINWAKQKIELMSTIKNRVSEDDRRKKEFQNRKELQNIYLKRKASQYKYNHQKYKQMALNNLFAQKYQNSFAIRNQAKNNSLQLQQNNLMIALKNKSKFMQIKNMQKQMQDARKAYDNQIQERAKINYKQRVMQQIERKKSHYQLLKKLTNEEQKLIEQLKLSQTTKMTQFKTLQHIVNPQIKNSKNRSIYSQLFKKALGSQKKLDKTENLQFY